MRSFAILPRLRALEGCGVRGVDVLICVILLVDQTGSGLLVLILTMMCVVYLLIQPELFTPAPMLETPV